ncbi:Solute carrier family 35 member G1 [Holothuria leucospilota]|uniref:Solute carrier family 35 member G1 n=1 Tax=Holothuria leucospilota TaxID=206669 RepID=A0A9Q0YGT4_HOLLE|nr:Solute carrier family 35 member G1 [Holothuria leucospilota]
MEEEEHLSHTQGSCYNSFLRRVYNYRGFIFAFAAATGYACTSTTVSALSDDVSSTTIVFVRVLMSMLLSLIVLCYKGIPILPSSKREFLFHCVNTVVTLVMMCTQYYAYHHMPPADACAIIDSYVAFAGLFGRLFLKEAFGFFEAFMVLFTILGVVLVSRPEFIFGPTDVDGVDELKGGLVPTLSALTCAVTMALLLVVFRKMGKQDIHAMKTVFYNCALSCLLLVGPITLLGQWELPNTYKERSFVVIAGLFAFSAYVLVYLASAVENAVYVSLVLLNEVYIVFTLGTVFLDYKPHWVSTIGIVLIVGSSVVLSVKKIFDSKKENSKKKERNAEEEKKSQDRESQYALTGKITSV